MSRSWLSLALLLSLGGCVGVGLSPAGLPSTPGERASGYGYIPLDPLPIRQVPQTCAPGTVRAQSPLLGDLPDLTIRFAVGTFDQNKGSLTFGPVQLTTKNGQYRVVLDHIQADAVPVQMYIRKWIGIPGKDPVPIPIAMEPPSATVVVGYEAVTSEAEQRNREQLLGTRPVSITATSQQEEASRVEAETAKRREASFTLVTIPVYVGVGLRLSADILALQGGVTLSGLGIIGFEAEARRVTGSLTVQTLGISGKPIASALPLPSKLDQSTVEAAIIAMATMRATMYQTGTGADAVSLLPRLVGLYSPIGSDPMLINAIYAELSRLPPIWVTACRASGTPPVVAPAPRPTSSPTIVTTTVTTTTTKD